MGAVINSPIINRPLGDAVFPSPQQIHDLWIFRTYYSNRGSTRIHRKNPMTLVGVFDPTQQNSKSCSD